MWFSRKKQTAFLALALASGVFVANVLPASAMFDPGGGFGFSLPSASDVAAELEQRYHLNPSALQNQGEAINVAGNKGYAPEVSLFFNPSDPKEGEKLSAKAFPMYFTNVEGALYYTWYVKRKPCGITDSLNDANRFCDVDGNGRISVEDWKITAMRILAQNGYDNGTADYNAPSSDNDGYRAHFGGDNKTDAPDYCYVHDNDSGTNYELTGGGCQHLFPDASGETTGDGSFGKNEEEFWGTNPQDPSTADNGNKDEANVAGLGQSTFTWNYTSGDEVGVAVEGTSLFPTKYADSSAMIMWAFPKKNCPPEHTDAKAVTVGGYSVSIPTANMDLNDCLEGNLVDPTKGGQATNLDVGITATPDNPVNDETSDKSGDTVTTQATVSNAQHNVTDMFFDWTVEIGDSIANFDANKRDITNALRTAGLLGNTKGNALDSIHVKLDMPNSITSSLSGGVGYLRFRATVTENFSGAAVRKGKSDIIVKFTSTTRKISAYKSGTELVSGTRRATLASAVPICNTDALDRVACRVIKNEIIGLRIDDNNVSNFYWTVNGAPLTCSKKVSNDCSDTQQGNENFFPVVGNPGDTYTVTVTGSDVSTGNALTLTRTFGVVAPGVTIESLDNNIVWPRLLGQYKDITGNTTACPNGLCNDYSTSMFESFPGSTLGFRAVFIPGFLASTAEREWTVDGEVMPDNAGTISFAADKLAGGIYNIGFTAQVKQSDDTRRALLDIWGVSPFESPEIHFSVTNQVQLQSPNLAVGPQSGPRKYLAAIVSYIPASVMFTFRIFLSAVLILFATSFLYTLLGDRHAKAVEASFSERE